RTEGSTRAPSPHSLHAALPIWKPARNTLYSVNWVLTAPWDTIWAGRSRRMRNQQETRGYMSGKIRQYFRDKKDDVQDYAGGSGRSEEHTSELQSRENLVCRVLL